MSVILPNNHTNESHFYDTKSFDTDLLTKIFSQWANNTSLGDFATYFEEVEENHPEEKPSLRFHFAVTQEIWDAVSTHFSVNKEAIPTNKYREFIYDENSFTLINDDCWYVRKRSTPEKSQTTLKQVSCVPSSGILKWTSLNGERLEKFLTSKGINPDLEESTLECQLQWYNFEIQVGDGIRIDIAEWCYDKTTQYAVGTIDLNEISISELKILFGVSELTWVPSKAVAMAYDTRYENKLWDSWKKEEEKQKSVIAINNYAKYYHKVDPTILGFTRSWFLTEEELIALYL